MSDKIVINTDGLHDAVMKILKEYGDKGTDAINLAVQDEAKEVRKNIRANVTPAGIKGGQPYKSGWQIDTTYKAHGIQCTVFNGGRQMGLVHLLEKGHDVVVNGKNVGHAKEYPHVQPATSDLENDLMDKIQKNLELLS